MLCNMDTEAERRLYSSMRTQYVHTLGNRGKINDFGYDVSKSWKRMEGQDEHMRC